MRISDWSSDVCSSDLQLLKQGGNAQQQPQQKAAAGSDAIKTFYVRTHPAELIAIEGEPQFADVQGTSLSSVTNTPADLFSESGDNWYALLSGRWFTAKSTRPEGRRVGEGC